MKKILTIIGNVFLAIILLVGLAIAFTLLPIKNNYKLFSVMSGSMQPSISAGSIVVVLPANSYNANDIITFKNDSTNSKQKTTTHRVSEIKYVDGEAFYQTKGDANDSADNQLVDQSSIIGKVFLSAPCAGYLISYVKTLPGLMLIIVIPAAIIIYEEIKKIHKEAKHIIKQKKEKKSKLSDDKITSTSQDGSDNDQNN